jgi:hypothetical protein
MSNAVAKKDQETTAVSTGAELGSTEDILSSNIVIPKLLLMQGLSDFVTEGKAVMGDLVRSTTGEKVGNAEKPVKFIPLTFTNTWIVTERVSGKFEYRRQEPMTAKNQDLPWEFQVNGTDWKRTKSLNVYALLVADIEAERTEMAKAKSGEMPDPDKALMPVLISFRSLSFAAGKDIVTHFAKARKFGVDGYVSVLELRCRREKNDKGVFFVFEIGPSGKTPLEFFETCQYWKGLVAQNRVQVDDSDERVVPEPETQTSPGPEQF